MTRCQNLAIPPSVSSVSERGQKRRTNDQDSITVQSPSSKRAKREAPAKQVEGEETELVKNSGVSDNHIDSQQKGKEPLKSIPARQRVSKIPGLYDSDTDVTNEETSDAEPLNADGDNVSQTSANHLCRAEHCFPTTFLLVIIAFTNILHQHQVCL